MREESGRRHSGSQDGGTLPASSNSDDEGCSGFLDTVFYSHAGLLEHGNDIMGRPEERNQLAHHPEMGDR